MKSYFVRFSDREEGPYGETQIPQMFADSRVNRDTPCKPASGGDWKTIDDFLPMLKYGTQLPPRTNDRHVLPVPPPPVFLAQRVSVVNFDIPFLSVLKIMFKWMAAAFIVGATVVVVVWLIVMALVAAFLAGAISSLHHP